MRHGNAGPNGAAQAVSAVTVGLALGLDVLLDKVKQLF